MIEAGQAQAGLKRFQQRKVRVEAVALEAVGSIVRIDDRQHAIYLAAETATDRRQE